MIDVNVKLNPIKLVLLFCHTTLVPKYLLKFRNIAILFNQMFTLWCKENKMGSHARPMKETFIFLRNQRIKTVLFAA